MNKTLLAIFALSLSTLSLAAEIQGTITKFSGMTVESHRPYSYVAIQTKDGQRIQFPNWVNTEKNNELLKSAVSVDAMVNPMLCTDMSSSCLTGYFTNIRLFKITFPGVKDKNLKTYSARVEKFSGRAVETGRAYSYIVINDKVKVAVPAFLDASFLLKNNTEVTITGKANFIVCTDMSAACGPAELSPLKSVELRF